MTSEITGREPEEQRDAQVIPLRPIADRLADDGPAAEVVKIDRSFEVDLDPEDDRAATDKPAVYVDAPPAGVQVRPIVPPALRSVAAAKAAAKRQAQVTGARVGYHALRAPFAYLPLALFWAVVGVFKVIGRLIRWWHFTEQNTLRHEAANANDPLSHMKLHREAKATRLFRGYVVLGVAVALLVGVVLLVKLAPLWAQVIVVLAAVPVLAHVGHPPNRPIVRGAVVAPRFRKLNADIVLRAYYAAGLGNPDKAGQEVQFGSTMSRDATSTGSQVVVDLPYGKTFGDVLKVKAAIASGLDVTEYQVFLTRDKTSTRRHLLFVADRDPLAISAGRTPMLDCKPRNIWQPFLRGLDERGRKVHLDLLWNSILVGAQPRKGKTFTARLIALYGAADPWVKVIVADGKGAHGSPDWTDFALVAHRYIRGTAPSRHGDPIEQLRETLREILQHVDRVNAILSTLPPEVCPDGKLTPELARDPRYPELRVWLVIIEEFQVYFETEDQDTNKEFAGLFSRIMAQGPSSGVILVSASQKPSGVGAGQDVQRLFNRYRDNHQVRFALKCGNRVVSEAVLGGDAYQEGYDASSLPIGPEYRGVGYLYGASDETPTVRTHLADKVDAQRILIAARKHRERLGTLSGDAAGDVTIEGQLVDPLADALSVIEAAEPKISWPRLATRLAEQLPDRYADITADDVSTRLRNLGIKGKSVRDPEFFKSGVGQGVARTDLETLAARRAVSR